MRSNLHFSANSSEKFSDYYAIGTTSYTKKWERRLYFILIARSYGRNKVTLDSQPPVRLVCI
jgi:hypothetical protein